MWHNKEYRLLLIILLVSFLYESSYSQQPYIQRTYWQPWSHLRTYNFYSIAKHGPNYFIVGDKNEYLRPTAILLGKYNVNGDSVFVTRVETPLDHYPNWSDTRANDFSEIVTLVGLQKNFSPNDTIYLRPQIIKMDTAGVVLFDTVFLDTAYQIRFADFTFTPDNGIILCGGKFIGDDADYHWMKLNDQGQVLWSKEIADTTMSGYCSTIFPWTGNEFLMPSIRTTDTSTTLDLITINANGLTTSAASFAVPGITLWGAQPTPDGGCIAWGVIENGFLEWRQDLRLYKFNQALSLEWSRTHSLPWNYYLWDQLRITSDSGYVMTGSGGDFYVTTNQSRDGVWLKLDKNGYKQWYRDFWQEPFSPDHVSDFVLEDNGTITSVGRWGLDFGYLIRTDSIGCFPGPCDTCMPLPEIKHIEVVDISAHGISRVEVEHDSISNRILKIWNYREDIARASSSTYSNKTVLYFEDQGTYPVCLGLLNECGDYWDTCFTINVYPLIIEYNQAITAALYPNPANQVVKLHLQEPLVGAILELVSISGQQMASYGIEGTADAFPIHGLPAGMYAAILRDQEGAILWRSKLMIE